MIEVKDIDEREWLIEELERTQERVISLEKNTYAAPHVWNMVAKRLRETYPTGGNDPIFLACRATIHTLAIKFAEGFADDEGFDPLTWLDKCSPDPDTYPFSEMWDD